jgi:hypothetical protein
LQRIAFWTVALSDVECQTLSNKNQLWGAENNQVPSVGELGGAAFMRVESILSSQSRQDFSIDCTGSSITRNIRRPYPFLFEIVDSSGVTVTTQPVSSCVENTDNSLVITGAVGKTLTYAITPNLNINH